MGGVAGPPLLRLPLLLLLSCSWGSATAEAETGSFEVLVLPTVSGIRNDNVTLQCKVQTQKDDLQVTLATWQRQDPTGAQSVAVFHPTQGSSFPPHPSIPESGRLQFVAARPGEKLRDASLMVRGLRAGDEANYTCHIATFPHGSKSARTWLRVLAKPQNKAEIQKVPLSPLGAEPVPVARCVSTAGLPPAQISWSLNGKVTKSQEPGPLPRTFTVTSLLALTPSSQVDGKNVSCIVEHETFEEPVLLPVTLSVSYPPEVSISGYDGNWYLGRSEATLNCDVRSNPEPTRYDWSTTTGPLPPSAVPSGSQLLIHSVNTSINTTFICRVTNALGTAEAKQSVLVKEEPPKDQSSGTNTLTVVLIVVLSVVPTVVVAGLVYRFWGPKCNSQNQRSSPSSNNNVSYAAVNLDPVKASSPPDRWMDGKETEGTR
ncbi:poliovirus receptor [Pteronotus mesoamericanus]|uniref:poliovirus receptor n=1 Tax=Pteronotus mesoamericanus TaxID=1884717 RepID=UPI0023EB830C|nr:poliovirus receptor [Pteronotus parnellii mesoamericanus]